MSLPDGVRHEAFEVLSSTSDEVRGRLLTGDPGNLWITAVRQSAGRGRRGSAWSTEPGNLAASLGLVDPASREKAATLSFVAALALHTALVEVCGPGAVDRLELKWPNDVLLDRNKIAGILVEGHELPGGRFGVVIGIGVNCTTHPGIEGPFPSASLAELGYPTTAEELFPVLARALAAEIALWNRGDGFKEIRNAWLARATGTGAPITVRLPDRIEQGTFRDIDHEGRLVLGLPEGGARAITAGEVFFNAPRAGS